MQTDLRNIEDLSKEELLGIIYNYLPNTLIRKHPCYCVCCFYGYIEPVEGVQPYGYECDSCSAEEIYDR